MYFILLAKYRFGDHYSAFLRPYHIHNTNFINPYISWTLNLNFDPTKGDLGSRYLFVFNSPHLSRTCLIGIRDMIRGGSPSYHFLIEHCVILLYTNVKICVKAFTTDTIPSKFTSKVLLKKIPTFLGCPT